MPMPRAHGGPWPLLVSLHGAGGDPLHMLDMMAGEAEKHGVVLLAPSSRGSTWDVIGSGYGPDVALIDEALARVFDAIEVDPARVGIGGFSDGASYALSLGLTNGELFSQILAYSPGFAAPGPRAGRPQIFISHGDDDRVLPIERCGRPLARRLRDAGYEVDYREFAGGHAVPPEILRAGFDRLAPQGG